MNISFFRGGEKGVIIDRKAERDFSNIPKTGGLWKKLERMPFGHPFVLYIKFTNQTYRSVYEFPEFADYGKLISFAFVIVIAATDDLGINIKALGDSDDFIG